jgi:hypothetical protein
VLASLPGRTVSSRLDFLAGERTPVTWKTAEGSTGRLLQYCAGYFAAYVAYGTALKWFQGPRADGTAALSSTEWLVYSTAGSTLVALGVCIVRRWYRLESVRPVQWGRLRFPSEWLYIMPSGVMTAIIIPATTLLYSLPISVMVAMVIMRGAVIVVSRIVDAVQIRQGLLHKRVHPYENAAVVFALLAVATTLFFASSTDGAFDFARSSAAMAILGSYVVAYGLRIYIMNYYKNTRGVAVRMNDKAFFAVEQTSAFVTLVLASAIVLSLPARPEATGLGGQLFAFQQAVRAPHPQWSAAVLGGLPFGIVAFFSVFLFMFKGRTATFTGLVNRLTSLVAGTSATVFFQLAFGGKAPSREDWLALVFVLVAVGFLTGAERRRAAAAAAAAASPYGTGTSRA